MEWQVGWNDTPRAEPIGTSSLRQHAPRQGVQVRTSAARPYARERIGLRGNFIELRDTKGEQFDLFVDSRILGDSMMVIHDGCSSSIHKSLSIFVFRKIWKNRPNGFRTFGLPMAFSILPQEPISCDPPGMLTAGSCRCSIQYVVNLKVYLLLAVLQKNVQFSDLQSGRLSASLPKSIEEHATSGICSQTAKPPKNPVLVSTGDPDQRTPPQISMRLVPAILSSSGGLGKPNKKT